MDRRTQLAATLREYRAVGEREHVALERMRHVVATVADPFDRDAGRTHVTASAIVIGPRGTVLHVHRRSGLWLQPGGHVDAGEAPHDAAVRETEEETGLICVHPDGVPHLIHVDVHETPNRHVHLDCRYVLQSDDVDPIAAAGESTEVRWFSWSDAMSLADAGLAIALERTRSRCADDDRAT